MIKTHRLISDRHRISARTAYDTGIAYWRARIQR